MSSTDKVLGNISAISTFIENFPMSILDCLNGKVYTSIFDFMIDVLCACGVDVNEIINNLLKEIYGIEAKVEGGIESLYDGIRAGAIGIDDQNEFMEVLEYSIKGIFMGLLSSVFTCSAIPVIPNKMFDAPNDDKFKRLTNKTALKYLQNPDNLFEPFLVPTKIIDPMGLLEIGPTSDDGRLFYAIEGGDKYYKKEEALTLVTKTETILPVENGKTNIEKLIDVPLYDTMVKVCAEYTKGNSSDNSEGSIKFTVKVGKRNEEGSIEEVSDGSPIDLKITVLYTPYGGKVTQQWDGLINKRSTETTSELLLSPENENGKKAFLNGITINGLGGEFDAGDKTWVYLSYSDSIDFINSWKDNGSQSLPWGYENTDTEQKISSEEIEYTEGVEYEDSTVSEEYKYVYNEYSLADLSNVDLDSFERVNFVPTDVSNTSPEYIVCYDGLNPNLLYRTKDMNAFLWYALRKGMKTPQVEYNHMMWDSRISAAKQGIVRKNAEEWNQWYNSKNTYTAEFKYMNSDITSSSPLFPIIQLEPQGMSENLLRVKLPAQRYFAPGVRNAEVEGSEKIPKHAFNASIYKFNWDYLENIQILRPKLLVVGLLDHLLGFSMSTIKSADINFTKKIIESKMSSAVKSIIEANDMEIEDCYTTFSNDEVNTMMEEMLLARYSGTMYGGETTTVRVHNTDKYLGLLDQVNASASMEGNITSITKLVTEVTADPGTEGSIDYGLKVTTDGNLLKKLIWAIVMPILLSIFTPQVLLLLYMNFELMGLTKIEDFIGQDFTKILNLLMNKIFGLLKSIIIFIKDKIVELLLRFFYEKILSLLLQYELILLLERITYWLEILKAALSCVPLFKFKRNKVLGSIDEVNYADIINTQDTPESTSTC